MKLEDLVERLSASEGELHVRTGSGSAISVSHKALVRDVETVVGRLQLAGLSPRSVVAVEASNTYEFIVLDLALIHMRLVPQVFPSETFPESPDPEMFAAAFSSSDVRRLVTDPGFVIRRSHRAQGRADEDLLTRVYSSGTSGTFKGLNISRRGAESVISKFIAAFNINAADRQLIFLPLGAFQQRLNLYCSFWMGCSVQLTPYTHVYRDLGIFRPTYLIAPPAFYDSVLRAVSSGASRGSLREIFGGNVRFLITGMAPIRASTLQAYEARGVQLLEAYGLTEVGIISWNLPQANRIGTVGVPVHAGGTTTADDGEILIRASAPLASGYFDGPLEDAGKTFRDDGFVATGDLGRLDGGFVHLIGRKKDIIVRASGDKCHPARLESSIEQCPLVHQSFVVHHPSTDELVAVLVVDNFEQGTVDAMKKHVESVNQRQPASQIVTKIILTTVRPSVENGLMTRNMKPHRANVAKRFLSGEEGSLRIVA